MNLPPYTLIIFVAVLAAGFALPTLLFSSISVSPAGHFAALAVDGCRQELIRTSCSLVQQEPSFAVGPPESRVVCSLSNGEERTYSFSQYSSSFSFNEGGEGTCRPEYDTEYLWFCANGPYDRVTGRCPGGGLYMYPSTTLTGASCCVPRIPPTCDIAPPVMPQGSGFPAGPSAPPAGSPAAAGIPASPVGSPAAMVSMFQQEQCGPILDNPTIKTYDIQCCNKATQTCDDNPSSRFGKSCITKGRVCGTGSGEICQGYEKAKCNPRQLVQKTSAGAMREKWEYKEETTECPNEIFGQDTDGDGTIDRQQAGAGCYCEPKVCCQCLYQASSPVDCGMLLNAQICAEVTGCQWAPRSPRDNDGECRGQFSCVQFDTERKCTGANAVADAGLCKWDSETQRCVEYFEKDCLEWNRLDSQKQCDVLGIPEKEETVLGNLNTPSFYFRGQGCTDYRIERKGHGTPQSCVQTANEIILCIIADPAVMNVIMVDDGCSVAQNAQFVHGVAEQLRQQLLRGVQDGMLNQDIRVRVTMNQGSSSSCPTSSTPVTYTITVGGIERRPGSCQPEGSDCTDASGGAFDCVDNGVEIKEVCCGAVVDISGVVLPGGWRYGDTCPELPFEPIS